MSLSLPITVKRLKASHVFLQLQKGWFKRELVGADIPCWPNYYSLLCCHIWSSSETTGWSLPASVGDWDERRLPLWSWIIKECVINRMIRKMADKCLHQSLWWKDFCHDVSLWVLANGRWITSDRLLQNKMIIHALLFGFASWMYDDKLSRIF